MKKLAALIAMVATTSALANPPATATPKEGADGVFTVSKQFAPRGKVFWPQYRIAVDQIAWVASDTCPSGYDKLAEFVRGSGETPTLSWDIRCITPPATPVATAPAVPK